MKTTKILSLSTITASLVFITGCTTVQTATNTNEVSNTNTNTVNTNATVANENTNTEQGSEVDTSDWLTYTNEEYGFSFKYPEEWGNVEEEPGLTEGNVSLLFSNREALVSQSLVSPIISVTSNEKGVDGDNLPPFDYAAIDFTKSDLELSKNLKRNGAISDTVTAVEVGSKKAVLIEEIREGLTGKEIDTAYIIVPSFSEAEVNLFITINGNFNQELQHFVNTISF
jgi:hypothetical protein